MVAIELDQINVLIGPNNAGKSSILRALYLLQVGFGDVHHDVRINAPHAQIIIHLENIFGIAPWGDSANSGNGVLNIKKMRGADPQLILRWRTDGRTTVLSQLPNREPNHYIVPYLSKRKTATYHEDVREEHALTVNGNLQFLAAKLSRLSNPTFPEHRRYKETCEAILGFLVTAIPSGNGQRPGVYCPDRQPIFIDQMGEGVPNIVALLVDLALSRDKLFLIEEPENDLHPQALKALLDLIVESSQLNQFVVSTHSNIVVRHLAAAANSKLYNVRVVEGPSLPPKAVIQLVEPTVEARLAILRELGYSFSDFDLWDGWLILEESSAERIIRDYLIPWFAPKLSCIRTLAAGGVDKVEPTFEDFHRLVRFTHLEEAYRNAAWVWVDGDPQGAKIIKQLQDRYKATWNPDHFCCFGNAQFEKYYPEEFDEQIALALAHTDKQARREAKRYLLEKVRAWLDEDEQRGKEALAKSATEVIDNLRSIEAQLIKKVSSSIAS
jgi:hypothetical protein